MVAATTRCGGSGVAPQTFVPVRLRSTRSTCRTGQKRNGGRCANTAAVPPLKLIQGMAPGGSATTSLEPNHEGVLLMARVPAVQHNTTPAHGAPVPVLSARQPLAPHLRAALKVGISDTAFRVFTAILLDLNGVMFGIPEAAEVSGLSTGSAVQVVGRLRAVGLLGSRRRTFFEDDGRRRDLIQYFVPGKPAGGAR